MPSDRRAFLCSGEQFILSAQKSFVYAKKHDIQVIKRHRDEKNQKSFKKHFTNVRILGIIDRQSGRRAETEH